MPKTKISEFSATPANNTDIDSINIAEGCAPSGINDAIRELMAQLKDFQTGAVGDSFNGPVGTTTAAAGAFTTLSSTGNTTLGDASGDSVTINGTATFANANPTLSAGTANGVTYLNGSKVVTSGSALTFDGSNVGVTASSSAGFVGITTQNTSAGAGASSGIGINNDSTAATYLRTYGSGQTNTLLGSVIANYTALLSDGAASNGILLGSLTNKPIIFGVNNAEVGRFTSTGLGIGTSSPAVKLHTYTASGTNGFRMQTGGTSSGETNRISFVNATGASDVRSGVIEWFEGGTFLGDLRFLKAGGLEIRNSSDSATLNLNNSGNLGLGVTPSAWGTLTAMQVKNAHFGGYINNGYFGANCYYTGSAWNYIGTGTAHRMELGNGQFQWHTAASGTAGNAITFSQAMTLDSSGNLLVGTTSTVASAAFVVSKSVNDYLARFINSNATAYGVVVNYSGASPNSTGQEFLRCVDSTADRMLVRSNGGIANYSANNVNLSDRREKTNFAPAKSYLDVICSIPVQTYNYIDQNLEEDAGLTLGVVAQDVQAVAPELVTESDWSTEKDGSKMRLSIYQTDLQYALMKALQELKAEFDAYKASHP